MDPSDNNPEAGNQVLRKPLAKDSRTLIMGLIARFTSELASEWG